MICVSDVHKSFRSGDEEIEALRGVSFEVPTGPFAFFVGPSGLGQEHAALPAGRPRPPQLGNRSPSTASDITAMNEVDQDIVPPRQDRLRLPAVQPDP